MKRIALLRGINAGSLRRVEMQALRDIFDQIGFSQVSTYLNSGNVIFESELEPATLRPIIEQSLEQKLGFPIPTLILTGDELHAIADAIPQEWLNDSSQRTDVAFLFDEINAPKIIDELPVKREFLELRYVKGAVFWNLERKYVYKSQLSRIISHPYYQFMTIRNINTVRFLAGWEK